MKKLILIINCGLFYALVNSFAMATDQPSAPATPVPRLGVEGGFTFGNLTGQNVSDVFGSRFGITEGFFLNLPVRDSILGFQPEFLYEQRGGKLDGSLYQLD